MAKDSTALAPWHGADEDAVIEADVVDLGNELTVAAPAAEQGVTVVADASASMKDLADESDDPEAQGLPPRPKYECVDVASGATLARLQVSRKKASFSMGFVAFHSHSSVELSLRPVGSIPASEHFDPIAGGTGGTCGWTGLERAQQQIIEWRRAKSGSLYISNVVLFLGDGLDSDPARTLAAAESLKQMENVKIAACLFSTKSQKAQGGQLLQRIASSPELYSDVFSTSQIRDFFMKSITLAA